MINNQTYIINQQLSFLFDHQKQSENINLFSYSLDSNKMRMFLSYIYEWNGLTKSSAKCKTEKEYLKKARNWLNGRRSKKYGNTLFFDMIESLKYYANSLSIKKYPNNLEIKQLYYQCLLYSYLLNICTEKVRLVKSVKLTDLICEHAIIAKTKTKQILQSFSDQHSKSFPCHRQQAIDYFKVKYLFITLYIIHVYINVYIYMQYTEKTGIGNT